MSEKVLVVDDDPSTLRLTQHILERGGYEVITATNGLVGLQKAQRELPSIVVLDLMLPGLDGFEICHRLKNAPDTSHMPILMLSAKDQDSDKAMAERVGADGYLSKPVNAGELLERVQSLLLSRQSTPSQE